MPTDLLVFGFRRKEYVPTAESFAKRIASIINETDRRQIKKWTEVIPAEDQYKSASKKKNRFRIDPYYIGYKGVLIPGVDRDSHEYQEVVSLINDALKAELGNPDVYVEIDKSLPPAYYHFLVYI